MYKKLPPLNSLLVFEAAARLNSFKLAAKELHQTPAAIAYQIKKLEESLNIQLFDRLHKGVELNSAGQMYFQSISGLLRELEQQTQGLKVSHGHSSLTVVTLHAVAEKWLMSRLADYRRAHAEIDIEINATEDLTKHSAADIVIGFSQQAPPTDAIILMDEEIFPVCSPGFLKQNKELITLTNLSNLELLFDTHWQQDWQIWLKANRLTAQLSHPRSLSFSLYTMVIDAAINGLGLAMGHKTLIENELEQGSLISPFKNLTPIKGFYYLSVDDKQHNNTTVKSFVEWLKVQVSH